jgi:hypothetical protein
MLSLLLAVMLSADQIALENDYVRVTRDIAPCASADVPECGDRVIVALGDIELRSAGMVRTMKRGDIAVFTAGESHEPPTGGGFFEVDIKAAHPPVRSPAEIIPPEKNAVRFEGETFFVFEERLAPGDTRARHSHSQRVVIQLNKTRLQQLLDGAAPFLVETVPERPSFSPPVIHVVKNISDTPLWGVVIEFKPER